MLFTGPLVPLTIALGIWNIFLGQIALGITYVFVGIVWSLAFFIIGKGEIF